MKNVCCGVPLRWAVTILLCLNLGFNIWILWSELTSDESSRYKDFLKNNPTYIFLDLCLLIVGALIFLAAITVINNSRKSAITLLTAAVFILLIDVFFLFCGIILLNSDPDSMAKILHIKNSRVVLFVYVLILAIMAFKFYSAWVFHTCRVELKRNSFRTNFHADSDVNTSGPAAYGENFQYAAPLLKFALHLSKCING